MVHLRSQLKGFSESGMLSEKEKDKMELPTSFRVNAGFMGNLVTVSNEGPSKDCRDCVRGGVSSASSLVLISNWDQAKMHVHPVSVEREFAVKCHATLDSNFPLPTSTLTVRNWV